VGAKHQETNTGVLCGYKLVGPPLVRVGGRIYIRCLYIMYSVVCAVSLSLSELIASSSNRRHGPLRPVRRVTAPQLVVLRELGHEDVEHGVHDGAHHPVARGH
jgi:hypothetical protein